MQRMVRLAAVVALVVWFQGALRADHDATAVRERKALLKAFAKMRDAFKEAVPNPRVIELEPAFPVSKKKEAGTKVKTLRADDKDVAEVVSKFRRDPIQVKTGGETLKAQNIVKVWAELENGTKAHLGKYRWKRNERFWVCFETALPVKVALYQDYGNARPKEMVLPHKDFPASYDVIMPGKEYKLPVRLITDDDDNSEKMCIAIMGTGTKDEPKLDPPRDDDRRYTAKSARDFNDEVDEFFKRALKKKLKWQVSNKRANLKAGADPGSRATSRDVDDVAIIAVGEKQSGYIDLVLNK